MPNHISQRQFNLFGAFKFSIGSGCKPNQRGEKVSTISAKIRHRLQPLNHCPCHIIFVADVRNDKMID